MTAEQLKALIFFIKETAAYEAALSKEGLATKKYVEQAEERLLKAFQEPR